MDNITISKEEYELLLKSKKILDEIIATRDKEEDEFDFHKYEELEDDEFEGLPDEP